MKVLWICNTLLPEVANRLNLSVSKPESWIVGTYNHIKNNDQIKLIYLFPENSRKYEVEIDNTLFISYVKKQSHKNVLSQATLFENILKKHRPDVIHIFGTESSHALAMVKAAEKQNLLDKTIISIQGLVSVYAKHYFEGLDFKTIHAYSLRDFIRHNNIYRQMLKFKKRGKYEEQTLSIARHVIGRTDWDRACVTRINPNINYHFCNESLRTPFYENAWDINKCEKHSIFVSQSNYPIKGFHNMLEAMSDIVKSFPDAHLYTTGVNPLKFSFKQKIFESYYSKHIRKLIKKYHLALLWLL